MKAWKSMAKVMFTSALFASTVLASSAMAAPLTEGQNSTISGLLQDYQASGAVQPAPEQGQTFWQTNGPNGIACASCHGKNVTMAGKHIKTKRTIAPMSPSANSARLADANKVEKWFKRNCKSVWNRECTITEKANVLAWLATQ